MAKPLLYLVLTCMLFVQNYAHADELPYSKRGNTTGGACASHSDCIQGYKNGNKNNGVLCLTSAEGNNAPAPADEIPPGGLSCGCLPDVKHCGYAVPDELK